VTRFQFLRLLFFSILSLVIYPLRALAGGEPPQVTKRRLLAKATDTFLPNASANFAPGLTRVAGMQAKAPVPKGAVTPITPNSKFYVEDIHGPPGSLDAKTWRLKITGKVDRPITLSLDQIRKRPTVNPDFFTKTLIFKGADGYHDSIPLSKGRHHSALLAHTMNGETLPRAHGFPLRLLVPGLYGIKQIKWIQEIEVSNQNHTGYWEKRNWTRDGKVKVISRIDFPKNGDRVRGSKVVLRGIAFAGDRGIQYVQVSTDGERNWSLAQLEKPLSPYSWVFWSFPMTLSRPGRYSIAVRAADQYSGIQRDGQRDPFPSGTSGIHRIQFHAQHA
jgi:DMSO/TMAO reductase YedYZ molybdopterin-dependent catalytic subunit